MLAAGTTAIAAATITFNGALLADTCVVNAGAGDNVTVTLPAVQASILTTNG
ncbi:MAG TPA: pilus assembly protein FimA, partial [Cupriavidus sp.]|nr:pilus assembly protein FimA [Cupriavidus sp.]